MTLVGSIPGKVLCAGWVAALLCAGAVAETAWPSAEQASSKKVASSKPHTAKSGSASSHASTTSQAKSHAASTHKVSHKGKSSKKSGSKRGQQKIDSERTREIQEALAREHYMEGAPSGKWDASTEEALRRFQADHGWQNKTVPDSRALIKLGLGPNHDHLLNPESAMTTNPQAPRGNAAPTGTAGGGGPVEPPSRPQP